MIGCGTATLTPPEAFRVKMPGARINLVPTVPCDLKVRLTWLTTRRLRLACCAEDAPRIAVVSLSPGSVFALFPIRYDSPPVWNGVQMRSGEIALYANGSHIYQRTNAAGRWGFVSVPPEILSDYSQVLTHAKLLQPAAGILRPPLKLVADLRRLHARACRLAETKPELIAHPEVGRAIEEDFLHLLVNCLTSNEARHEVSSTNCAEIMGRFEQVLASSDSAPQVLPEIARATGVPEGTLRKCCEAFLGMGPGEYARLRRLNLGPSYVEAD
jgi:hypothetical protein